MITVWHGSSEIIDDKFDYSRINTGDGAKFGHGFYFAENRAGGEYMAKTMQFRTVAGYLYEVSLDFDETEVLCLNKNFKSHPLAVQTVLNDLFLTGLDDDTLESAYQAYRQRIGDPETAMRSMLAAGIKLVRVYEQDRTAHGDTYVVFDAEIITIKHLWQYTDNSDGSILIK